MRLTNDDIKVLYLIKDYLWLNRPYELNIFGIRGFSPDGFHNNEMMGVYNDTLGCSFLDDYNNVHFFLWRGTTDASNYYFKNPLNANGVAKLVPGQYTNTYKLDLHKGQYLALCERLGPVMVERVKKIEDFNKDNNPREVSYRGINIHHGRDEIEDVGAYSAGCQVFYDLEQFDLLISLCKIHKERYGNSFHYTLLEKKDFEES